MTLAVATSPLTAELIQEVIAGLPIQGRIMLRLLLIQHLDVTHDEILFMVSDRPDPRCVSGTKPITTMTQESIAAMTSRRDEYRRRARLRRERTWLQCVALKKLAETAEAMADRAAALLSDRGVSAGTLKELKEQARVAVPRPALRVLEERWDKEEISAEDYQKHRLAIEMQTLLRFAERFRKRLDLAERERQTSDQTVLQDHEIGHIWGIPAGTLAARKVKFLSQYLHALQAKLTGAAVNPAQAPPLDLWKETLAVLARTPVERSIATYDGLEQTETALIEKLTAYALIGIPEQTEVKFWNSLVFGASSNAMHSESTRTLFGLQRLVAIQQDTDTGPDALDEELLKRTAPKPKAEAGAIEGPAEAGKPEITELQKQILHNFIGEDVSGRASDKW
ncbi:hypothetical protein [Nitrospira moscoviensis]|uniref:Uncharacterized protein n=1 Tax=Nitrospira moscoviensis TaxID=42253 RepID=A0A0K2GDC5_NITMO|nr:hypothetical protein [Nitrospira moscoviensis]ALA58943.1 hypothetical protein NITMOv2_2530 [Nitrospira moscoviensis]